MSSTPTDLPADPAPLRARFAEGARAAFAAPLAGRFVARLVDEPEFQAALVPLIPEIFPSEAFVDLSRVVSPEHRAAGKALDQSYGATPLEHRLLFFDDAGALAGFYWGFQEGNATYYMCMTGVRPSYRRSGIYRALLERLVPHLRDLGFRRITSRHHADNNAVIVPKLKAGFRIVGFEISPRYGLLLNMRLWLDDEMAKLESFRIDAANGGEALRAAGVVRPVR